ncbi:MAG: hypothetical protein ABEJ87_02335 [Candidatus Nanohalobium sp.]
MDKREIFITAGVLIVSLAVGFAAGRFSGAKTSGSQKFVKDVDFSANSSHMITDVNFDNRTLQLIIQPGNSSGFFVSINGTVQKLKNIQRDGEVHDLRNIFTVDGKMYIFYMRYTDDPGTSKAWVNLYRIQEL